MPNLEDAKVAVQDENSAGGESQNENGAVTSAGDSSNGETTSAQSQGQGDSGDGNIGSDNLPPELEETRKQLLRDYHSKTQKLREERLRFEESFKSANEKASTLDRIMVAPWFKEAMDKERQRRLGQASDVEIGDDVITAIIENKDKNALRKVITDIAQSIVKGRLDPELDKTNKTVADLRLERELETVASKFKGFRAVLDSGNLDPYLQKGYDYEAAYKLYRHDNELEKLQSELDKKAQEKAQEILNESRNGAVSKGGITTAKGSLVVEANNFEDAFDKVWDAMSRGAKDVQVRRKQK